MTCPLCPMRHRATGDSVPAWLKHHTGLSDRQLSYWRQLGLFHTPAQGSGNFYPWSRLLPRVEWLRRIHHARGETAQLDYWDGKAGVDLIGHCDYAIRVGRDPWRPFDIAEVGSLPTSEVYMLAAVPPTNWLPVAKVAAA